MQNPKFNNCGEESALREDKILLAWLGKNLIALKQVYRGLGSRELNELEPCGHAALMFVSEKYSYFFDFGACGLRIVRKPARFYSGS